jgi:hypothetical protein
MKRDSCYTRCGILLLSSFEAVVLFIQLDPCSLIKVRVDVISDVCNIGALLL